MSHTDNHTILYRDSTQTSPNSQKLQKPQNWASQFTSPGGS